MSISLIQSDNLLASNSLQSKSWVNKNDKKRCLEIRNKFYQLCNHYSCIKRILFKYFAEPDDFIISNTDTNSCCSNCNESLQLKVPECTIYCKRGVAFNARKNYIFNRLKKWAQSSTVFIVINNSVLFPMHYTVAVPHILLH